MEFNSAFKGLRFSEAYATQVELRVVKAPGAHI
jgi:hypothetical protein